MIIYRNEDLLILNDSFGSFEKSHLLERMNRSKDLLAPVGFDLTQWSLKFESYIKLEKVQLIILKTVYEV